MEIVQQFEIISKKIDKLIELNKWLEAENLKLKNRIEKLENELKSKEEIERRYEEVNVQIKARIDGLLAQMEDVLEVRQSD